MPVQPDPNREAEEILKKVLGANLREYRKERGISQLDLAAELGLSPAYYGGIERGERNLQLSTVGRIADAIGMHPLELLTAAPPSLGADDGVVD